MDLSTPTLSTLLLSPASFRRFLLLYLLHPDGENLALETNLLEDISDLPLHRSISRRRWKYKVLCKKSTKKGRSLTVILILSRQTGVFFHRSTGNLYRDVNSRRLFSVEPYFLVKKRNDKYKKKEFFETCCIVFYSFLPTRGLHVRKDLLFF